MNTQHIARNDTMRLRTRVAIWLGGWALKTLGATWRVTIHGRDALNAHHASNHNIVLILWHGQILPCTYAHSIPSAVLISEHRDGEILAGILRMLGHTAIRGSTSRGGARALLEAVAVSRSGRDVAMTPDGPRGPRHSFAAGALVVAFRSGAPIVSIVAHTDRLWRLRSWDAFEIPKPFARVTIVYSALQPVQATDIREASAMTELFAGRMHAEVARARALATKRDR